jgi:chromosomal replication initiation ATPase DnaA
MENVNQEIKDALPLSASELMNLRDSLIVILKKVDKILSTKNYKGQKLADYILNGVCSYYKITLEDLKYRRRGPRIVERRRMTASLLNTYTDRTLQNIADMLGYKKHETALYHIREAKNLLSNEFYGNEDFKKTYKQLIKYLKL